MVHLVNKKIVGVQDIDYDELAIMFPEQSPITFINLISNFKKRQPSGKPLYAVIADGLSTFNDYQETKRAQCFRDEIVEAFDRIVKKQA